MTHAQPFVREHAAWALSVRPPLRDAVTCLVRLVADGDFTGRIA